MGQRFAENRRENFHLLVKFPENAQKFLGHSLSSLLFVYGTLRQAHAGPVAAWLRSVAQPVGPAIAAGTLYRIDDYPGFVPDGRGEVVGDLFALPDAPMILARLDHYEECTAHFFEPHEYRRERLTVRTAGGPVEAWTYVYAHPTAGLPRIESGDFLIGYAEPATACAVNSIE